MTNANEQQGLPEVPETTAVRKRRGGRPGKIKRTSSSVRPGSNVAVAAPTAGVKGKTLAFIVPTNHDFGTVDEFTHIHQVATRIAAFPQVGVVTSIQIHAKKWEIVVNLQVPDGKSDDEILSEAFTTLEPTINSSAQLRDGFSVGKPSKWEFRIGTFVADEGGF